MTFDNFSFWVKRILSLFDIPGGVVIGLFSLMMLAIIPWCILNHVDLPATVRDVYLGVITAFAGTNVAKHIATMKNGGSEK